MSVRRKSQVVESEVKKGLDDHRHSSRLAADGHDIVAQRMLPVGVLQVVLLDLAHVRHLQLVQIPPRNATMH